MPPDARCLAHNFHAGTFSPAAIVIEQSFPALQGPTGNFVSPVPKLYCSILLKRGKICADMRYDPQNTWLPVGADVAVTSVCAVHYELHGGRPK